MTSLSDLEFVTEVPSRRPAPDGLPQQKFFACMNNWGRWMLWDTNRRSDSAFIRAIRKLPGFQVSFRANSPYRGKYVSKSYLGDVYVRYAPLYGPAF